MKGATRVSCYRRGGIRDMGGINVYEYVLTLNCFVDRQPHLINT